MSMKLNSLDIPHWTPSHSKKSQSPHPTVGGKVSRLTTKACADLLYKNGSNNNSRRSSLSDDIFEDIEGNFLTLNEKVKKLESQLDLVTETQYSTNNKHGKLKNENFQLGDRVHWLEEQIREMEVRSQERLVAEQKKQKEILDRQDRQLAREIEGLTVRLHQCEGDYLSLKEEAPRLRAEIERLKQENLELDEQLNDNRFAYSRLIEENDQLKEISNERELDFQRERESNAELLDELGKELDELRKYRNEQGCRSRTSSIDGQPTRVMELDLEIKKLKQENTSLLEQNEELHGQLLNNHVEEGRTLLHDSAAGKSLAEEMDDMSRDEILTALVEQKEVNYKLKEYIDRIILLIVERNPSLLEIRGGKGLKHSQS